MNAAKILGILIAFLGSLCLLIVLLMNYPLLMLGDPRTTIYYGLTVFAWIGSVAVRGKRIGGVLVLAVGVIIIIFYVLFTSDPIGYAVLAPFSLFSSVLTIPYVTIEALLMIGGGILIIASGPR